MNRDFRVDLMRHPCGDIPVLLDRDGLPLAGPSEWVLRKRGLAWRTQERNLRELIPLCEWERDLNFEIRSRIASGQGFTQVEIDALVERLRKNLAAAGEVVIKDTFNSRVMTNRCYLQWLFDAILQSLPTRDAKFARIEANAKAVSKWMKEALRKGKSRHKVRQILTPEAQRFLLGVLHPDNPHGFATSEALRHRNFVIVLLMLACGLRDGELLSALAEDFFAGAISAFNVVKRDPDPDDLRGRRPAIKCGSRVVPLEYEYAQIVDRYILEARETLLGGAEDHGYLIVGDDGQALSQYRVEELMRELRAAYPRDLPSDLTPHSLRHAFTQNAQAALEHDGWSEAERRRGVALLRGDLSDSSQDAYTEAETLRRAQAALRKHQISLVGDFGDVPC